MPFLFVKCGELIPGNLFYKTKIQSQIIGGDPEADMGVRPYPLLWLCVLCVESELEQVSGQGTFLQLS